MGLLVIHYNKQNQVFSPLKIGRIDIKKVACSEWMGGVQLQKGQSLLITTLTFIIIPFQLLLIFKKKYLF